MSNPVNDGKYVAHILGNVPLLPNNAALGHAVNVCCPSNHALLVAPAHKTALHARELAQHVAQRKNFELKRTEAVTLEYTRLMDMIDREIQESQKKLKITRWHKTSPCNMSSPMSQALLARLRQAGFTVTEIRREVECTNTTECVQIEFDYDISWE